MESPALSELKEPGRGPSCDSHPAGGNRGPGHSHSNPCLCFLNQEEAAIGSLAALADGYSAHFHPVSQLKKQVSHMRAIGTAVHGACGRNAHGASHPAKPDLRVATRGCRSGVWPWPRSSVPPASGPTSGRGSNSSLVSGDGGLESWRPARQVLALAGTATPCTSGEARQCSFHHMRPERVPL